MNEVNNLFRQWWTSLSSSLYIIEPSLSLSFYPEYHTNFLCSPLHKPQRNGGLRRSFDLIGEEVTVRADDVRYNISSHISLILRNSFPLVNNIPSLLLIMHYDRYAVASSFDARQPPIGLFHRHNSSSSGGGGVLSKSNSVSSFNLCDSRYHALLAALIYNHYLLD